MKAFDTTATTKTAEIKAPRALAIPERQQVQTELPNLEVSSASQQPSLPHKMAPQEQDILTESLDGEESFNLARKMDKHQEIQLEMLVVPRLGVIVGSRG
jgi:hypothetical protein